MHNGIELNMDMKYMSMMNGSAKSISSGKDEEYVTRVDMILPLGPDEIDCKTYKVEYENTIVEVHLKLMAEKKDDPIITSMLNLQIGTSNKSGLPEMLPLEVFTDNKGVYPSILASLVFPFRIATWVDNNHETGIKMDYDYEEMQVTGGPKNSEKIKALLIINRLLKSLNNSNQLIYEDITAFLEVYFRKGDFRPILSKLTVLASKNAYKNAIYDYYLKNHNRAKIDASLEQLLTIYKDTDINDEISLSNLVNQTIEDFLIHNIEHRRWIEPFWDGERKVNIGENETLIPRLPKNETRIQPTLHVILDMALRPLGVHVLRESDEGVGSLDFRFSYTNKEGLPLSVGVEFKVAHRKKIKHGLTRQLPAYLKAIRSRHGTFVVMWFKDEQYFKEPKDRELEQMLDWLIKEAKKISYELNLSISAKIIDASISPSASNL
ncbi:MAG: hypothetical protein AB7D38_07670 [Sulfurimonas sp.]|uniref:hypothetical protein n=1 Tax=Sulfurimonas sp. TaxID=2022749 RepID=UPI003D0F4E5C